jgi:RNA polymerase sigma factor (sigma-70 family)
MTPRASDRWFRQLHRLFEIGAVGMLTDAQLLDCFLRRREDGAETAFEELMTRHGPMVLRICRGVLRDQHDAEDAFQAVFLILANRARSIRRRESIASWLFGVAHRVASRARSRSASRRARDLRVAAQTAESYLMVEECHHGVTLHDEIRRLPEGLRAAVTLCYLEGLTYEAAAQQLGVSVGTVRGRLARARQRLRRRLTARGVTIPAGLLIAGIAGQAHAAVPASLAHSTVRIALGFMAGDTAAVLARGVLNSMLLSKFKVAAVLLLIGVAGRHLAWSAATSFVDNKTQADAGQVLDETRTTKPTPAPETPAISPMLRHRLTGMVLVDGTGKTVAGAKLHIHVGDLRHMGGLTESVIESGAGGMFAVDLPVGRVHVEVAEPPAGYYWFRRGPGWVDSLLIAADVAEIHREYHVREGTVWDFQFARGKKLEPVRGFVSGIDVRSHEAFEARADDTGRVHFTLPSEGRVAALTVRESSPSTPQLDTGSFHLRLSWESDFRPADVQQIVEDPRDGHGIRLIDAEQRSATLFTAAPIEPVIENGKLVIRVILPDRELGDFAAVTGQVLDAEDRPVRGARVGLVATRARVSNELQHQSTTNAEGRYRLRDMPRRGIDGKLLSFQIVVAKAGYAGFVSPPIPFNERTGENPQLVEPIRLKPGVVISGIVVDHRGFPVGGASVYTTKPVPYSGLSDTMPTVRADEAGRFTMDYLRTGKTQLTAFDSLGHTVTKQLLVESSQTVVLQFRDETQRDDISAKARAR